MAVLKALWKRGPSTVRDLEPPLREAGFEWAYTTLQTLLGRLATKGCVVVDRSAVPHVFKSAVSRDDLLRERLKDLAQSVCGGDTSPLVLSLVRESRLRPEEVEELRALLDRLEAQARPSRAPLGGRQPRRGV
jgi:BlaI family transcriptional regulator, penicillinase repressor